MKHDSGIRPGYCLLTHCLLALGIFLLIMWSKAGAAPLAEVLKRNELVICAHANALPYSRMNGSPAGFQIDLGRVLAGHLGVALKVHFMRLHREPRKRECDALMSVAVPGAQSHESAFLVSDPYMVYRPIVVVPKSRQLTASLEEFAPGHVAVQRGSWAHYLLTQRSIPVWVRFRTEKEIIAAVESGQAEAGIASRIAYGWYMKNHTEAPRREAVELELDKSLGFDVGIGLMSADQALLDRVNRAIARMRQAGTFAEVLARYGIALEAPFALNSVPTK